MFWSPHLKNNFDSSWVNFDQSNLTMFNSIENFVESLGKEPMEIFGFSTEEEMEIALESLMKEVPSELAN